MKNMNFILSLFAIIALIIGCEESSQLVGPSDLNSKSSSEEFSKGAVESNGAVYSMTNDMSNNEIIVFNRKVDGSLSPAGRFSTKGLGSGGEFDPLGSQGSIVLNTDNQWLLAVNAGSNQISVFKVQDSWLDLTDVVFSDGGFPISITVHNKLVYVLNVESTKIRDEIQSAYRANIKGFRLSERGQLEPISNSTGSLSINMSVEPAQIKFSPDGKFLIVTEKQTSIINVYLVQEDGLLKGPITHRSVGETPFGFSFIGKNYLIVAESFNNLVGRSAISSYGISPNGNLINVTESMGTKQTGGSRLVVTKNGNFGYMSNINSATISSFAIDKTNIRLKLLEDEYIISTGEDSHPTDMALSSNDRFLYVLKTGSRSIGGYRIQKNGSLRSIDTIDAHLGGLPVSVTGLVAY